MQRVRGESRFNGGDSLLLSPEGGRCGLTSSVALPGAAGNVGHSHGFRSVCGNSTLGRGEVQGPVRVGTRLPQQPAVLRLGPWARKPFHGSGV